MGIFIVLVGLFRLGSGGRNNLRYFVYIISRYSLLYRESDIRSCYDFAR